MHDCFSNAYVSLLDAIEHHEKVALFFVTAAHKEALAGEERRADRLRRYGREMRVKALRMSGEAAALVDRYHYLASQER
ncbi:hypothetical protein M446_6881 [Methylobacterium sp. 4-46]|uniref:hypothetical protein n=1 Tax=unclassified Methylobacterium TaxID=2615210 RepID=UPI000165CB07|nr:MULTISPECIES: hypothetical protein [Methylobacterium]ACA21123.1 hypothetical protein M446_6881 [Methylobacterium sp. 4-46]WFT80268.1 hypothetical protein QA634_34735 [Methylobacterium nodulans]